MPKFDTRGNGLAAAGNKHIIIVAGASPVNQSISTTAGVRLTRFWATAGTGVVDFYDNNLGNTTGDHVWSLAATTSPVTLDCPMVNGLAINVAINTTVVVVYSE